MIYLNRDGLAGKEHLHCMLAFLGKYPTNAFFNPRTHKCYLSPVFGEKLNDTDPEDVSRNTFACFDKEATGTT